MRRRDSEGAPNHSLPGPPAARCGEAPAEGLLHAVEQFNRREYFECHETLEHIWNAEPGPIRTLYKGILQVGVGCYHLLRGNYRGATIKLQSGADYLEPFAPICMGVEVARLITEARRLHAALVALGPERFREFDPTLIPLVHLTSDTGEPDQR
jgi:predicted metal-dependent hydrolase